MNADEAWEQFKKAVNDQRALQKTSATEKLDVIAAQNLQNSLMMEELQEKIEELTAPTAPGANPDIMAGAGGMPPDMMGMPPEMMAQMAGGAPPGAPPGGVPPMAGTAEPSQSFALSAKKKRLVSKNKVLKAEDVEKSALNSEDEHKTVGDGDNPIEAHYNQLINALGEAIKTTTDKTTAIKLSATQAVLIQCKNSTVKKAGESPVRKPRIYGGNTDNFTVEKLFEYPTDDNTETLPGGFRLKYDPPHVVEYHTDENGIRTKRSKLYPDRAVQQGYMNMYNNANDAFMHNPLNLEKQGIIPFLSVYVPDMVEPYKAGRKAYTDWVGEDEGRKAGAMDFTLGDDGNYTANYPEGAIGPADVISLARELEKYGRKIHDLNPKRNEFPLTRGDIETLYNVYSKQGAPDEYLMKLYQSVLANNRYNVSSADFVREALNFMNDWGQLGPRANKYEISDRFREALKDLDGKEIPKKLGKGDADAIDFEGMDPEKLTALLGKVLGSGDENILSSITNITSQDGYPVGEDGNPLTFDKGLPAILSKRNELKSSKSLSSIRDMFKLNKLLQQAEDTLSGPILGLFDSAGDTGRGKLEELLKFMGDHPVNAIKTADYSLNNSELEEILSDLKGEGAWEGLLGKAKNSSLSHNKWLDKNNEIQEKIKNKDYSGLTYKDFGFSLSDPILQIFNGMPPQFQKEAREAFRNRIQRLKKEDPEQYFDSSEDLDDALRDWLETGKYVFSGDRKSDNAKPKSKHTGPKDNFKFETYSAGHRDVDFTPAVLKRLFRAIGDNAANLDLDSLSDQEVMDQVWSYLRQNDIDNIGPYEVSQILQDLGDANNNEKMVSRHKLPQQYDEEDDDAYDLRLKSKDRFNRSTLKDLFERAFVERSAIADPGSAHKEIPEDYYSGKAEEIYNTFTNAPGDSLSDLVPLMTTKDFKPTEDQIGKALQIALRSTVRNNNLNDELTWVQAIHEAKKELAIAHSRSGSNIRDPTKHTFFADPSENNDADPIDPVDRYLDDKLEDGIATLKDDALEDAFASTLSGNDADATNANTGTTAETNLPDPKQKRKDMFGVQPTEERTKDGTVIEHSARDNLNAFKRQTDLLMGKALAGHELTEEELESIKLAEQIFGRKNTDTYKNFFRDYEAARKMNKSIRSMISCRGRGNGVFKY